MDIEREPSPGTEACLPENVTHSSPEVCSTDTMDIEREPSPGTEECITEQSRNFRETRDRAKAHLRNMRNTPTDYLVPHTIRPIHIDTNSEYDASYNGEPTKKPPEHRKFPKVYEEPQKGYTPLKTSTTAWFKSPDVPYKTPMYLLDMHRKRLENPNSWQYSTKSIPTVYPH